MWHDIEKEGNPEKSGIYLACMKHSEYPYSLIVRLFDGKTWKDTSAYWLSHWSECPIGPEEELKPDWRTQ